MDDPQLEPQRHRDALAGLARLNAWSVSDRALFKPIAALATQLGRPLRLLDVACGGGDQIVRLARRARRQGFELRPSGLDVSPLALEVAADKARRSGVEARFLQADIKRDGVPEGFDAIVCTLFAHHLEEADLVGLFRAIDAARPRLAVVQDLRRTRGGVLLAWAASQVLTRSPIVHNDALLSVGAAFTRDEVRGLAVRAGLMNPQPTRVWPLRWQLAWRPRVDSRRTRSGRLTHRPVQLGHARRVGEELGTRGE
ncbi:MAG: methyltransferase domain-containing protein [Planctomycetota bacterium]|jgi:SAM-dependent methyltransferase